MALRQHEIGSTRGESALHHSDYLAVEVINFLLGWGPYQGLGLVVSTLPPSYDLTLLFHFGCRDRVLTSIPRPRMTWNSLSKLILELAVM